MNSLFESLRIALIGLTSNKVRAALTMLGIIIGVAAVIALVSVGQGFSAYVTDQFEGLGTNVLFILPDQEARDSGEPLTTGDAVALTDSLALPGVQDVAPEYRRAALVSYGGQEVSTTVSGVTPEFQAIRNYDVVVGRFIDRQEVEHRGRVAVLGYTVAQEFFPGDSYPLGEIIRLNDIPFEVIAVLDEKGSTGPMDNDDFIFIPLTTAQTRLFTGDTVRGDYVISNINVQVRSEEEMASTTTDITNVLRLRHHIEPDEASDFTIVNQADLLDTASSITGVLTAFLGAIAAISLLVGGIGIMNIMLVSVTERTREIGLRKAIGAGRNDILWQFLVEAMTLSLIGGLVGMTLGIVSSQLIGPALNLQVTVSAGTIMLAAGFSAAVGLFFGIYPALRAASLHPIDALRYE
jgi:putative ABC transport system permease protein